MKLRMVGLALLALCVYAGLTYYIGWNGLVLLDAVGITVNGWAYWIALAVISISYVIGRMPFWQGRVTRFLKVVGSYYFGILEYLLILLPIADLLAYLLVEAGFDTTKSITLLGLAVLLVLAFILAYGSWNAWSPVVRTYDLEVDKRAGDREQLKVVMASDIHLGNIVGNRHLGRMVSRMNELKPDVVLLPGDVIDEDIEPFIRNRMDETLQRLKTTLGTYAVLGNHEYYGGHIEEYVKRMNEIGIPVLRDEAVLVDRSFYVVGRKDKTAETMESEGRLPVSELLAGLDAKRPVLLMDHQPYRFEAAAQAGADVLLCGHTHRGQFAPNHWVTKRLFELDWGYMQKDKMHVVVSSGFGTWGPAIRLASRSEIIELNIRFKP
ncbi:metallophosphoesterase [Gorillibacterium timonense]|uniref:metallophosphoesterase n=1 Tax=Gorillibacterium timonense TaxID=1689269 RepID=UPI00071C69FB|nr:metallophosphoesterase [Gorillibacterium timonense]